LQTKTKYAEQQAYILRRKLEWDAELSPIQIQQEAEALETEIRVMVFNVTFNNISGISWRSVALVEETLGPGETICIFKLEYRRRK
jgi:hypothetical protein